MTDARASRAASVGAPELSFDVAGHTVTVRPEVVVIAGYTGRDAAAVRHHVDELAAEGIAPPPQVPMYWALPASVASQAPVVQALSAHSSGEVELVVVVEGEDAFVTLGSDHSDRHVERADIAAAKAVGASPLGREAWRLNDVAGRWDGIVLSSWLGDEADPYQHDRADVNVPPEALLAAVPWPNGRVPFSYLLFCGTVPTLGGLRPHTRFRGEARRADGATLELRYDVEVLALDL
ncbi:MAG: DUF2848 domain-containing protein [Acidimicrobiia bacterium]|nr:DUF2848 domain-containing protein [Acidimicrobiia bacterium]